MSLSKRKSSWNNTIYSFSRRHTLDGYLTIMWPQVASIQMPTRQVYAREMMGWAALAAVVLLLGAGPLRD